MEIALRCWVCGNTRGCVVDGPPQFAFEVASWANDVGWIGVIDPRRGRLLVFCSEECQCKAKTNKGHYRARPLPAPQGGEVQ